MFHGISKFLMHLKSTMKRKRRRRKKFIHHTLVDNRGEK
jgi:hypothetical protein